MRRTERAARQLPLLPAADMGLSADPVGDALGIVDDDSDDQWRAVMDLYGRMAVRAYWKARAESEASPRC